MRLDNEITKSDLQTIMTWGNIVAQNKNMTEPHLRLMLKLNKWYKDFHKLGGKQIKVENRL